MNLFYKFLAAILFFSTPFLSYGKDEGQIFFESNPLNISFPQAGSIFLPIYSVLKKDIPGDGDFNLEIYILVPEGNTYKNKYVGTIHPEGAPPVVRSVFFHDVNKSPGSELFVLVSYSTNHYDSGGEYFKVYIYNREVDSSTGGLSRVTSVEEKLGEGLEGSIEGKPSRAPYKNAADVRKLLKKFGY